MKELQTRMKLVDQIYELSKRINEETEYLVDFELHSFVETVFVRLQKKSKFKTHKYDYSETVKFDNKIWNYMSRQDMVTRLEEVIVKLESYL